MALVDFLILSIRCVLIAKDVLEELTEVGSPLASVVQPTKFKGEDNKESLIEFETVS